MSERCYGCMRIKDNDMSQCERCGHINGQAHEEHYYLSEGSLLAGRYLVGKVLGHGGFGITYIGLDQRLDIVVAIKEYLPSDTATRALGETTVTTFSGEKKEQYDYGLKRFLDEAQTLARYNQHPCIVSTSDFFEENNTAYLVMEYLDGISLSEYLKRKGGSIVFKDALEIMMPVMDALKEVHKSGLIHRDISPDNVYITRTGQVKLLDFGAARFALGEKSKSLSVVLKPGFAPPEQYSSRGKQGSWTDVYAVAATIYRMVHGKNLYEAMDRMMDDSLELSSSLDDVAKKALTKALSIRVEERYQTINELQDALKKPVSAPVNQASQAQSQQPQQNVQPQVQPQVQQNAQQQAQQQSQVQQPVQQQPVTPQYNTSASNGLSRPAKKNSNTGLKVGLGAVAAIILMVIIFGNSLGFGSNDEDSADDYYASTAGDNSYMMPALFGMPIEDAMAVLDELSANYEIQYTVDAGTLEGHVAIQSHPMDTEVEFSDLVTLYVSQSAVELEWFVGSKPEKLDPHLNYYRTGEFITNQMFEGLVTVSDGIVKPGMADNWGTSNDGLTVTFYLRDDLKWSDGTPLTANDIVYSWLRSMEPFVESAYSWLWKETEISGAEAYVNGETSASSVGIKAIDEKTLELKLNRPNHSLVSLLSHTFFVPVKESIADGYYRDSTSDWATDPATAVSNGPFVLSSFNGNTVVLERNEHYWDANNVSVSRITGYFADNSDLAVPDFFNGHYDIASSISTYYDSGLTGRERELKVIPKLGTSFYTFNMNHNTWSDTRVRQAVNLAIDRDAIISEVMKIGIPAYSIIPPNMYDANGVAYTDVNQNNVLISNMTQNERVSMAQELLSAAGYPNGQGFPTFSILFNESTMNEKMAEMIQKNLNTNLGITGTLEKAEWSEMYSRRQEGDYEFARSGWITDIKDPIGILRNYMSNADYNDTQYYNPYYDDLLNKAMAESDASTYSNYLYEAYDIFQEETMVVPIYHYTNLALVADDVKGYQFSAYGSIHMKSIKK